MTKMPKIAIRNQEANGDTSTYTNSYHIGDVKFKFFDPQGKEYGFDDDMSKVNITNVIVESDLFDCRLVKSFEFKFDYNRVGPVMVSIEFYDMKYDDPISE